MTAFAPSAAHRSAHAGINITPLVDVLLVLLVIFMLAAPMATQRLPLTNAAACRNCQPPDAPPVRLAIKRTGELYWDGAGVTRAGLAANRATLSRSEPERTLEFHVESGTRYDEFTSALAAAQDAGIQRISVAPTR